MAIKKKSGRGGKRKGAGRPTKAEEQALVEKLTPYDDDAMKALVTAVRTGEPWAIKLFMSYRWGMPKQTVDHQGDTPFKVVVEYADKP